MDPDCCKNEDLPWASARSALRYFLAGAAGGEACVTFKLGNF